MTLELFTPKMGHTLVTHVILSREAAKNPYFGGRDPLVAEERSLRVT